MKMVYKNWSNWWEVINIKKIGFHNKVTKKDAVMLLLLSQLIRDAIISENSKRFGNRRQPRRGAGNNDQFTSRRSSYNEVPAHKQKLCNSHKRKLAKYLFIYRGITVCSEVFANFTWPAVRILAKLKAAEITASPFSAFSQARWNY